MTYTLLAVIIVLIVAHFASDLARLRRYDWYARWLAWLPQQTGGSWQAPATLLLSIGLPVLVVAIVQLLLDDALNGLPAFVFATAVLFYIWGPRDLDRDVHAAATTPPTEQPGYTAVVLRGPVPESGSAMSAQVGRAALRRWFGALFWFVLLGAAGAVLYRLVQLAADEDQLALPAAQRSAAIKLIAWLEWPVVHLMTLGMAIATDFDAVLGAWRARRQMRGSDWTPDPLLLDTVTAAAVKADLQVEDRDEEFDAVATVDRSALLLDALAVMWRVLVVWLAILALLALATLLA